jgi:hypothetical protein
MHKNATIERIFENQNESQDVIADNNGDISVKPLS